MKFTTLFVVLFSCLLIIISTAMPMNNGEKFKKPGRYNFLIKSKGMMNRHLINPHRLAKH
jgi:hypothetical protein